VATAFFFLVARFVARPAAARLAGGRFAVRRAGDFAPAAFRRGAFRVVRLAGMVSPSLARG
jgi:hypothetical protein